MKSPPLPPHGRPTSPPYNASPCHAAARQQLMALRMGTVAEARQRIVLVLVRAKREVVHHAEVNSWHDAKPIDEFKPSTTNGGFVDGSDKWIESISARMESVPTAERTRPS